MLPYNKNLKEPSRQMRKDMTEAERLFWSKVRKKQVKGVQFYRQKILGGYIVDFYCHRAKLVVEIDGGQHYEAAGRENDMCRDDYLASLGLKVLRFTNREVLVNTSAVMETVYENVQENPPQSPFEKRGGLGKVT